MARGVVVETFDDETRTVSIYWARTDTTTTRPYTPAENDEADARATATAEETARLDFERALGLLVPNELAALQAFNAPPEGAPWRQPTGATDAYPIPSIVTFNGKQWENLTPANVWQPGVAGWREIVAPGQGLPEWVQPTGSEDAYSFGDRVRHNGHEWTSTNPGERTNVWEPGVFGWDDDGPETIPNG